MRRPGALGTATVGVGSPDGDVRDAPGVYNGGMIEGVDQAVSAVLSFVEWVGRTWRAFLRRLGVDAPEPPADD